MREHVEGLESCSVAAEVSPLCSAPSLLYLHFCFLSVTVSNVHMSESEHARETHTHTHCGPAVCRAASGRLVWFLLVFCCFSLVSYAARGTGLTQHNKNSSDKTVCSFSYVVSRQTVQFKCW